MRVIAIVNQKGGCGKTTTAVNLAGCLSVDGARVLVVDLDPRAGASGTPVFEANDAYYLPIAGFAGVSAPGPRVRIYRVR